MTSIRDRVHALINRQLRARPLTDETLLAEDLMLDSIDALELVLSAEREFVIELLGEDAERLKTVGDVVALVEASLNRKARDLNHLKNTINQHGASNKGSGD
jgi:acyl carrier protein